MHDAKNCLVERYVPHGMDIFEMFADLTLNIHTLFLTFTSIS